MCQARGTVLQFGNFLGHVGEELLFVDQARAKFDYAFHGAGHAFAEPQGARVIFFGVVDGLKGSRANALHIPEMEEFMRGNGFERIEILFDAGSVEINCGGMRVFHASARGTAREVVEEDVFLKRAIFHPVDGSGDDLLERSFDLVGIVVGWIGVDHHTKMRAGFVEIGFPKRAHFYRRVHQAIVILGDVGVICRFQRRRNVPRAGHMAEMQREPRIASVHGIHQDLGKI